MVGMKAVDLVPNHPEVLRAFELDVGIKQEKAQIVRSICTAAEYLIEMRDKKLFKHLDHDTFNDYLGDPDVIPRSTAYSFIHIYEKYVLQHGWTPPEVEGIGHSRLQLIAPVVDRAPDDWKHNAQQLSTSDLINEVRAAKGKPPMNREEPDNLTSFSKKQESGSSDTSSYPEIALSLPCPICGGVPVEKAHYPTTQKAGAKEDEFIPLCHECHMGQHQAGFTSWFDMYGNLLFRNFIYPMLHLMVRQSGVKNGREKAMDCVCCNADGDSVTDCLGINRSEGEEHTAETASVVAESVKGE
jgi:hypothetical protein